MTSKERRLKRQLSNLRKKSVQSPSVADTLGSAVAVQSHSVSTTYSGPIPPPNMLAEYDALVPGAAAQILALAEDQSRHRMAIEKQAVKSNGARSWAGLTAGFAVAMTGIICGTIVMLNGMPIPGGALGGTALAGLVGVFIYGTRSARLERIEKTKLMTGKK